MYKILKRVIDVVISIAGLILLSPLLLLVAVLIKIDSSGSILFKQRRLGLDGKEFEIYKFRSMKMGAEKSGSGQYSFSNDPRVTKVGKIIRSTSIDELPQFINILKGDMSLIGPRPTLTYHPKEIQEYSKDERIRFDVRPGVTGWAQVNGRKNLDWSKRFALDKEYVQKMSFWFDLKIFLLTIKNVVLMKDNVNTNKTTN